LRTRCRQQQRRRKPRDTDPIELAHKKVPLAEMKPPQVSF
jgi:hypothetical protein